MPGLLLRKLFDRSAPPPPDQINIGEGELAHHMTALTIGHRLPPHCTATTLAAFRAAEFTAEAAGGTGPFIAWGRGDPAWDDTPVDVVTGLTALVDLLGEFVSAMQYVVPDPAGVILTSNGAKYTHSGTPTNRLYIACAYTTADEADEIIREIGVYLNTAPVTWPPPDPYVPVADIMDVGHFIAQDRVAFVERSSLTSGAIKIVVKIGEGA